MNESGTLLQSMWKIWFLRNSATKLELNQPVSLKKNYLSVKAITIPFSANVLWWITEKNYLNCLCAIKYLKAFLFSDSSILVLLEDQDQSINGYGNGSEFPEELQAVVAEPTIFPLLFLTCVNRGVSAPMTGLAPSATSPESFPRNSSGRKLVLQDQLEGCQGSHGTEQFLNLLLPFLWTKKSWAENHNCATDNEPSIYNILCCWKWCQIMSQELHSHFFFLKTRYADEKLRQRADRWITWRHTSGLWWSQVWARSLCLFQ